MIIKQDNDAKRKKEQKIIIICAISIAYVFCAVGFVKDSMDRIKNRVSKSDKDHR